MLTNISGTATIAGSVNLSAGTLALNYASGTPSLTVTNGALNFNGNAVTVTVSGSPLAAGSYKLISTNAGGLVSGTLPSTVTIGGAGTASDTTNLLKLVNSELYLVVDHPPVAQTMTVARTAGLSLHIALSDLATNWTDADGDTVTLSGINLVTTNGVTLQTNSSWIFYTNGSNVNDQISYGISDGQGGANIGYINIVVNNSITASNLISTIVGGNPTTVSAFGIPGYSYVLQRTTNLFPMVWVDISTNTAATNGAVSATDNFSDLGGQPGSAYYRLRWQP